METYFAYLCWCVDFNERHLIDPTSDKMEWNHTLPQCLFKGHGPGQWLTLRQHAIATALQSLAFDYNCLCPWHIKHLPKKLWEVCRPLFVKDKQKLGKPDFGNFVQPFIDRDLQREAARKVGQAHVESGHLGRIRSLRDPDKLAEHGRELGVAQGKKNVESGQWQSIKPLGAAAQHAQRWINLAPGFPPYESTPCGLSKWQKTRGIDHKDKSLRRRIS